EALLDSSSLSYIAPLARSFAGAVKPLEALVAAFRSGEGVAYADYGDDLHEGQAAFTKPLYENLLAKEWLPGAPEVHERRLADPPARVADVACGQGAPASRSPVGTRRCWSTGSIPTEPRSREPANTSPGSGVEDRVTCHERNAA